MSRRLLLIATALLAVAVAAPAVATARTARKTLKGPKARMLLAQARSAPVPYAGNEEAMRWADEVAQRRHLDREWVRQAVAHAQYLPVVARLMQPAPAGTAKNWRVYRSRFIDQTRIAAGVRFWQDNREALRRAEAQYGVPPEIIVGIIGVETIYGQQMGNFRVLDALATLSFDFPQNHPRAAERSAYFRGELEQFLALQSLRGGDPAQPLGSYAGAIGMTQFMPSSILRWAVDFDGDGRIDLAHSAADAIGSVANYFKSYGWQRGMPAFYPVTFDPARLDKDALLAPDILPTFSVASFTAKGAVLDAAATAQYHGSLALVELQNGDDAPQYVAGTENFYVITRYNWSSYYAMAVIELGQSVKDVVMAQDAMAAARSAPSDAAAPMPPASAASQPVSGQAVSPQPPRAAASAPEPVAPPQQPASAPGDAQPQQPPPPEQR